jgi:hypothetical protein
MRLSGVKLRGSAVRDARNNGIIRSFSVVCFGHFGLLVMFGPFGPGGFMASARLHVVQEGLCELVVRHYTEDVELPVGREG